MPFHRPPKLGTRVLRCSRRRFGPVPCTECPIENIHFFLGLDRFGETRDGLLQHVLLRHMQEPGQTGELIDYGFIKTS